MIYSVPSLSLRKAPAVHNRGITVLLRFQTNQCCHFNNHSPELSALNEKQLKVRSAFRPAKHTTRKHKQFLIAWFSFKIVHCWLIDHRVFTHKDSCFNWLSNLIATPRSWQNLTVTSSFDSIVIAMVIAMAADTVKVVRSSAVTWTNTA